jgi:hypothetical protein
MKAENGKFPLSSFPISSLLELLRITLFLSLKHLRPQFHCTQHRRGGRLAQAAQGGVDHRATHIR